MDLQNLGGMRDDPFAVPLHKPGGLCMSVAPAAPLLGWSEVRQCVSSGECNRDVARGARTAVRAEML